MNLKYPRSCFIVLVAISLMSLAAPPARRAGEPNRQEPASQDKKPPVFEAFQLGELREKLKAKGGPWLPFLDRPTLSVGIYTLQAGAPDPQGPHNQDEVYYVIEGQGTLRVGEKDQIMKAGSIAFVAAHETHKFHSITQDLLVLVFFSKMDAAKPTG